jgi:signal transduction histidine kinase
MAVPCDPADRRGEPAPVGTRTATVPDAAARASLARLLDEARHEILTEWIALLASQGLPHQRQAVQEDPQRIYASFDAILEGIFPWLRATDADTEARAREDMRAMYREFGWRWAERDDAAPALAVDPPRMTQAIWAVLLRRHDPALDPSAILNCAVTLNALAMDLAMARVSGYLAFKEQLLASQRDTLSRLMDELTRVETRQRQALALDLHDNLAQRLASLFNGIQHCSHVIERDIEAARGELRHLRQVASEALRDARTMIRDLHFGIASRDGGLAAIADYLADLDADTGIRHEARISATLPALPPTQETLVLRVIQEALTNVHKHAAAHRIVVTVDTAPHALVVEVRDDGRGFDVDEALARSQKRGRLGLIGMRERADLLGGTLTIVSAPGAGTTVRLTVPQRHTGARPA